jgi:hypothetical protein
MRHSSNSGSMRAQLTCVRIFSLLPSASAPPPRLLFRARARHARQDARRWCCAWRQWARPAHRPCWAATKRQPQCRLACGGATRGTQVRRRSVGATRRCNVARTRIWPGVCVVSARERGCAQPLWCRMQHARCFRLLWRERARMRVTRQCLAQRARSLPLITQHAARFRPVFTSAALLTLLLLLRAR